MYKNFVICLLSVGAVWSGGIEGKELSKIIGQEAVQDLSEIEQIATSKEGLLSFLMNNSCYDSGSELNQSEEAESNWATYLKLGLLDVGVKSLSEAIKKLDSKNLNCGESLNFSPSFKLWSDDSSLGSLTYSCPDESNPQGIFPSVIASAKIKGKECFVSFSPKIIDDLFKSKESISFSDNSLASYATSISCVNDDKVMDFVVFSLDDAKNPKVVREGKFKIADLDVFRPYYGLDLSGGTAGATFNFDGPYVGAAFSATIIGNVMSIYGGTPVSLDMVTSALMLSDDSKKNLKDYLKEKNIDGKSTAYFSLTSISGRNFLLENTEFELDEFNQQLSRVGITNIVSKTTGADSGVTLKLNTSVGKGGALVRAGAHMRVSDKVEVYASSGFDSNITGTVDLGNSYGVTLGAQYSTLNGPGVCTGYFTKAKNGIKKKKGVCISQGAGEYYSQGGCPELYGTSCSMNVFTVNPALGYIGSRTVSKTRPGDYYRVEDGMVGYINISGEDGVEGHHFQLYQFPKDINEVRDSILAKEENISKEVPLVFEKLPIGSKDSAQKYDSWLSSNLSPFLKSNKSVKGVRISLSDSSKAKNQMTSDGILVVRNLNASFEDLEKKEIKYKFERKSKDEKINTELATIIKTLQDKGLLIDIDLPSLTENEQLGLKTYLQFLVANNGIEGLRGRRFILKENKSKFLGMGEEDFNIKNADIEIQVGVLEAITELDYTKKVPDDFKPESVTNCKSLKGEVKDKCMQNAYLSFIYSNNFQFGGKDVVFVDQDEMRDIAPGIKRGPSGKSSGNRAVPTTYANDENVYVLSDAKRIEGILEPGVIFSPYNSAADDFLDSEEEKSAMRVISQVASGQAFSYDGNQKKHNVSVAKDGGVLYRFYNKGKSQYELEDTYGNKVGMEFNNKELASCVKVQNGVATLFYKKDKGCGQYNSGVDEIAGTVDLNNPNEEDPLYTEVVKKNMPALMHVTQLKK